MMIDDGTLESILYLSRFKVGEGEKEKFKAQVNDVIDYFNLLEKIDTSQIDPDSGALMDPEDLRPDEVQEGLSVERLKSFAVQFRDGYFSVPRIFEEY